MSVLPIFSRQQKNSELIFPNFSLMLIFSEQMILELIFPGKNQLFSLFLKTNEFCVVCDEKIDYLVDFYNKSNRLSIFTVIVIDIVLC